MSNQDLVARIAAARQAPEESEVESPTTQEPVSEEVDSTTVDNTEIEDETADEALPEAAGEEVEDNTDESIDDDQSGSEDVIEGEVETTEPSEDDDLYVTLGDEDFSLTQIKEWKSGALRQSDYTKKTQELANQRKEFETFKSDLEAKKSDMDKMYATLQVLSAQEEIDWEDLRANDPAAYLEEKEKKDAIDAAISQYSEVKTPSKEQSAQELQTLISYNPSWLNDKGQYSDDYKADMAGVDAYFKKYAYTAEDQANINTAREWQTILLAAKSDTVESKKAVAKKKVKKAPISSKPGAKPEVVNNVLREAEERHKREGSVKSAAALMAARRGAG